MSSSSPWDKSILEDAINLRLAGKTYNEIAIHLNQKYGITVTDNAVRKKLKREIGKTKGNIQYYDKKEVSEETISDYLDLMTKMSDIYDKLHSRQTKATVEIEDDKPIAIALSGDWHVGEYGVDYKKLTEVLEIISHTDGVYHIGLGDYKGNYIQASKISGTFTQFSPELQDKAVLYLAEKYLQQKSLCWVRGCHDSWDYKVAGKDFVETLAECTYSINLWHGGEFKIFLNNNYYEFLLGHKYLYESGLNTTNSQRRYNENFGGADVVAIAHKHFPDFQEVNHMKRRTIRLRVGSFKVYDEYGQQVGRFKGEFGVPIIILFPHQKKMQGFLDFYEGIKYLKYLREGA